MEIKAGLTQALSLFPLLCSSEKGGGGGEWEEEKGCLLHCAKSQEQTLASLFPQPSCSQPLTLPCLVPAGSSRALTAEGITP